MSMLKQVAKLNGKPGIHTGRMSQDFMPARGNFPLMREEEFEELSETTYDSGARLFEVTAEEDRKKLQEITDNSVNGWVVVHERTPPYFVPQSDGSVRAWVWCVWSEPYKELNTQQRSGSGIGQG